MKFEGKLNIINKHTQTHTHVCVNWLQVSIKIMVKSIYISFSFVSFVPTIRYWLEIQFRLKINDLNSV